MDEGFFVQIVKKASEIRLSSEKKAEFRKELELAMLRHPLPEKERFQLPGWISMHRLAFASSLIGAVVLASGTGVSLAAERTLPGDQLYPVKTSINERLREVLSLTPQAKIAWEVQRIERRIAEADELSSFGRLDQDARSLIEDEATEYASHLEELTTGLEDGDAEREYIEARLQQAFESGAKVKVSFEKRKVIISEREEGVHDEESEPYDDEESDDRERRESEEDEREERRSESMKNLVTGASVKTNDVRDDEKSSGKKRTSSSVTEKSEKSGSTASSNDSNEKKFEESDDEDRQDEDQKDEDPDEPESEPSNE